MVRRFVIVVTEILLITFWNYKMSGSYYSLDVLYCLPIIQASRIDSIRAKRHSDTQLAALMGIIAAVVWSIAEAAVVWPSYPLGAFAANIFTRSVTFTVLGRVLTKLWKERGYFRKDSLTGLANRVEFDERFAAEQLRSQWANRPYSLLFVQIDQLNLPDSNRNIVASQAVLKAVAGILMDNSRCIDTVARIGENRFCVLFPETDEYICGILGMRIKSASVKKFQSENWSISLSIGHVTVTGSARSFDEISREASDKMYKTKIQEQERWSQYNTSTLAKW